MILNPFDDRPGRERAKVALTYVILIAFNIAAWLWAWFVFLAQGGKRDLVLLMELS